MDNILSFIKEKPWIIFAVLTALFFLSMIRLGYKQWQYKKSFKAIKSMRSDRILSKIYLKINNGYGDFYDVKISTDGEKLHRFSPQQESIRCSFQLNQEKESLHTTLRKDLSLQR